VKKYNIVFALRIFEHIFLFFTLLFKLQNKIECGKKLSNQLLALYNYRNPHLITRK